mmetsp:Transcript_38983/g.64190  ORF Transcript_38983/g.64190 Transcript_38983/m.64190 type:complete len:260 (-) Transcript_38983:103-882(-)
MVAKVLLKASLEQPSKLQVSWGPVSPASVGGRSLRIRDEILQHCRETTAEQALRSALHTGGLEAHLVWPARAQEERIHAGEQFLGATSGISACRSDTGTGCRSQAANHIVQAGSTVEFVPGPLKVPCSTLCATECRSLRIVVPRQFQYGITIRAIQDASEQYATRHLGEESLQFRVQQEWRSCIAGWRLNIRCAKCSIQAVSPLMTSARHRGAMAKEDEDQIVARLGVNQPLDVAHYVATLGALHAALTVGERADLIEA